MVVVDKELCVGCGTCVADCIQHALSLSEGKVQAAPECFQCGHCVAICPHGAVSISNYSDPCIPYDSKTFDIPTETMINALKFRRSIRSFRPNPVSMEHLHLLMDAAGHMPTARNTQSCRFIVVQDSLPAFKELIWNNLRTALVNGDEVPLDEDTLDRFLMLRELENPEDYLFRNAPALLCIEASDPLDAGLAAAAIEMVGSTLGLGFLYNGYLRRIITADESAWTYLDSSPEEKPLQVCMLMGYQKPRYYRTAPRRRPSVVLR